MSEKTIVICRPVEDSIEIAAAVTAKGFKPLIEPVLDIKYLQADFSDLSETTRLVFTSANAVKAFSKGSDLRDNPVYTVGPNTADAARLAGFSDIESAAGTVDDLVEMLLKACAQTKTEMLYVRAEEISKDLKSMLAKGGVLCRELTAYRSVPASNLSLDLLKALDSKEIAAFLFFSVKGAGVFADLLEQYGRAGKIRTSKVLCISEAVLQSVSVLPFSGRLVADTPDRYGMIKLLEQLRIE